MSKTNLLKKLNKALSPNKVDFSAIDSEINVLKKKLEETVNIQTVEDVSRQLKNFQNKLDFQPIINEIEKIGELFTTKTKELELEIKNKSSELAQAKERGIKGDENNLVYIQSLNGEISALKIELKESKSSYKVESEKFTKSLSEVSLVEERVNKTLTKIKEDITKSSTKEEVQKSLTEVRDSIDAVKRDILSTISNLGGGSQNRQIKVNGIDVLKRYTDINFIGSITATDDNTDKNVDLDFSLVGGVDSVSNSDGTLTISPTLGNVIASLNLNHANTWTGLQTFSAGINPGFTTGSVIFQGSSGLAQDNSNFFWDDTNNRLGIGTNSPRVPLDVLGGGNFNSSYVGAQLSATPSIWAGAGTNKHIGIGYDTSNDYGFIYAVDPNVAWKTLRLNPNGGEVRIGSPANTSGLLNVGGSANFVDGIGITNTQGIGHPLADWTNAVDANFQVEITAPGAGRKYGIMGSTVASDIAFKTNNTEKMTITSAGDVGIGIIAPNSTLQISGSLATPYVAKTSTYTITATDHTVNCTSGTFTVNLPTSASITGREYVIKNSGAGVITIDGSGSETIDGATTYTLNVQYQSVKIQSNGTNWIVI